MLTYDQLSKLSNADLLTELSQNLDGDELQTINNMTIGLKLKTTELSKVKKMLLDSNPETQVEVLELALQRAMYLTKLDTGSSLSLDANGNLNLISRLGSKKNVKSSDMSNFEFLASFDATDKDLETMLIESVFKKIVELSDSMFDHLEPEAVLEIKRRISGVSDTNDVDADMFKIS